MIEDSIFDVQGFRFNIGIILLNKSGEKAFWGKRIRHDSWQFPQGGMQGGESDEQAALRELHEEVGLTINDVEILGKTESWFKYRLPVRYRRPRRNGFVQCIGQKQRWFLMRLINTENKINLNVNNSPEFETWQWYDYWKASQEVVHFKRKVYYHALTELSKIYPQIIRKKETSFTK